MNLSVSVYVLTRNFLIVTHFSVFLLCFMYPLGSKNWSDCIYFIRFMYHSIWQPRSLWAVIRWLDKIFHQVWDSGILSTVNISLVKRFLQYFESLCWRCIKVHSANGQSGLSYRNLWTFLMTMFWLPALCTSLHH